VTREDTSLFVVKIDVQTDFRFVAPSHDAIVMVTKMMMMMMMTMTMIQI